eukprot:CAMPEP_0175664896 /NCGR_PEP_ID=MMETSP0097-20121207/16771_1 /TAXON_ID=311494 /ORGANISM="Alexandrium monilatum, Strain CCMP3105" /LENGTH=53 /DNA_ID=CAMNT_0016971235 /DNA_START=1 /DNA_END=162 /DNA_ORIENTATION=+
MSGSSERGAFSQTTGMRPGYFARMRFASAALVSKGTASWSVDATAQGERTYAC